jgi:hypothetical protein
MSNTSKETPFLLSKPEFVKIAPLQLHEKTRIWEEEDELSDECEKSSSILVPLGMRKYETESPTTPKNHKPQIHHIKWQQKIRFYPFYE